MGAVIRHNFGRDLDNEPVGKAGLAKLLGRSVRWVEYRLAEGLPSTTDRRGRRRLIPSECRQWLAENEWPQRQEPLPQDVEAVRCDCADRVTQLEELVADLERRLASVEGSDGLPAA